MIISDIIKALYAGNELRNSAQWKDRTKTVSNTVVIISILLTVASRYGFSIDITPEDVTLIAGAIGAILGTFYSYITVATSKKVGIKTKPPVGLGVGD